MVTGDPHQTALWAAVGTALVAGGAEWLHLRRTHEVARLAFGPTARPRSWTATAPVLRVTSAAAIIWSLIVLLSFDGSATGSSETAKPKHELLVLLDVSPSMEIADAGREGSFTRRDRATQILKSVFSRTGQDAARVSMACVYRDAKLLVRDCQDRDLILHFSDRLPLHLAFPAGKTSLLASLNTAGGFVRNSPPDSVTMLLITDGDAVPDTGLRELPRSVAKLIVAGVGNPHRATTIDGHASRQNSTELGRIARRLGGTYHDANTNEIPQTLLETLSANGSSAGSLKADLRRAALAILMVAATTLCLLELLLDRFGTPWRASATIPKESLP